MRRCIGSVLLGLLIGTPALAEPLQAFTDRKHPLQLAAVEVSVIYLDDVAHLEQRLSEGLSSDPAKAQQQALALLHSTQGQQLHQALLEAYAGLASAWSLGITRIPAVVKDGHVVYGEANIARAVQRIEAFKAGRRP